jgi:hypothetical protein
VKNIGGYVKSRKGRLYTVVILVNTKQGNWRASQLQNNIIKWLVNYKGRGVAVKPSVKQDRFERNSAAEQKGREENISAYYIQAGSFAKAPTKTYLSKMRSLGFSYSIENDGNYKVLIGPYSTESVARDVLKKVRSSLNKGAFLTQNNSQNIF